MASRGKKASKAVKGSTARQPTKKSAVPTRTKTLSAKTAVKKGGSKPPVVERKPKRRTAKMADDKKHQDDERKKKEEQQKKEMEKNAPKEKERYEAAQRDPVYREPKIGSTEPGQTTMANPARQNVAVPIPEPTDDPMATPSAGPVPNPPSRPGGDQTGEPNVTATGEKLPEDHPDYRHDVEGQHGPDHRSAEEKRDHPLDDKGQADNTRRGDR